MLKNFHSSWEDIPIFLKTYELYKTFYGYLPLLPRKDRYAMGEKCEIALIDLLEAIIMASNLTKQEKLPILRKASAKVDILKVFFRLGKDLKIVDNKKYQILDELVSEIGRMLGGWIKTTQS